MLPGEDRAARRVLMVCLAAGATTLLDQAVLNIAVPRMRRSLRAGVGDVQWIVAGYSLAFGLAFVPGGSLGDAHGRKRFLLAGVAVFLLAGATAASGGGPGTLIAARLVQGAAAGLVNSEVIGTLQMARSISGSGLPQRGPGGVSPLRAAAPREATVPDPRTPSPRVSAPGCSRWLSCCHDCVGPR